VGIKVGSGVHAILCSGLQVKEREKRGGASGRGKLTGRTNGREPKLLFMIEVRNRWVRRHIKRKGSEEFAKKTARTLERARMTPIKSERGRH